MILYIIISVVLILVVAFFIFLGKTRSMPIYFATYQYMIEKGHNEEEALKAALIPFLERAPYNILTESDLDMIIESFKPVKKRKKAIAALFLEADKSMDASFLKNSSSIKIAVDYYLKEEI